MVVEWFVLGCTGFVLFLHGANFLFHALSSHMALRALRFVKPVNGTFWVLQPGRDTRQGSNIESKVRNYLISLYAKCKFFTHAHKLIDEIPEPDLVSWSSLVSGYAQNGFGKEALLVFREMHALGVKCNEFTFPSVLKGCAIMGSLSLGKQVHGTVVVSGYESDVFVANTLVVMYAKCGEFLDSKKLFDQITEPNAVSWNAMFSCYVQNDFCEDAVALFHEMVLSGIRPDEFSLSSILNACTSLGDYGQGMKLHGFLIKLGYDTDQFSENALVDMYAKLGELEAAVAVFEAKEHPDIVSWNAIIAGCVLHDYHDLALQLLVKMKRSGIYPNIFSLPSALKACASMGYKKLGKQLHSNLIKMDIGSDLFVSVGLIDMYAKCEAMEDARKVYNRVTEKDLIAWNALISGYSQNGEDEEALSLFAQMYRDGVGFNQTTLSSILKSTASLQAVSCCRQVHALSVKSGYYSDFYVVNSLIDSYGKCGLLGEAAKNFEECSLGNLVAYTSMITAYSQYGEGEEALKLYHYMQNKGFKPDPFVCSSAVNACANLSAYEQGKQVHSQLFKFGFAMDTFAANSLVNMYARCGSIDDASRAFSKIPERGIVSWSAMIGGLAQHAFED
ncbi:Pentatricopeptide repeat [Dillenia turbinata]|uniref:Pentatricopeptide repeat n=1 Tax=Dillenia turbinata TaxID=194707 RepID=A0AAN8UT96_9MAGN